jgi:tetratricopeptide (TPR) repeat protein
MKATRLGMSIVMLCSLSCTGLANPGSALNPGAAQEAFRQGQFAKAAELGRSAKGYDEFILATRATLALAAYQTKDRASAESLIDKALAYGQQAQALNEKPTDALLQQAIALGYRAKLRRSPTIAKSARALMEQALAREPDNPLALAALGGWNGEAVADLGGLIARTVLGARKDEAYRYYTAALRADPNNVSISIFYAFTLLRLNAKDNSAQATQLLNQALAQKAEDGFDALLQNQAREVLMFLAKKDSRRVAALLALYQPFGQILSQ